MDAILDTMDDISTMFDSYVGLEVPVPDFVRNAGDALSKTFTGPSFPYRIEHIDLGDPVLWQALIIIVLQPLLWNVIGRFEHYTRLLSKLFVRPTIGTCALALWILIGGLYRDAIFVAAIEGQQTVDALGAPLFRVLGSAMLVLGAILVFSSSYQLGFYGTFLGDYFGILMDERITAFPFNVLEDPMYAGSTLAFIGKAVLARSPAGILMAMWVHVVYRLASLFEGPFTSRIYAEREAKKKTS